MAEAADAEVWTVATLWASTQEGDLSATGGTSETFPTWTEARTRALRLTCLNGARAVKVVNPDGDVHANWDRWSNRWHEPR